MLIYTYSNLYDPAMPVLDVSISGRSDSVGVTLTAVVDSGADATMIPASILQDVAVRSSETRWLRGVAGGRYRVSLYPVYIVVGDFGAYIPVVGDPVGNEVILGRDVLNQLRVTLDGRPKFWN
ncbi:MAG: hypothetical protein HC802_16475 [Caldilineaceae bacterium]|nr:hypothetical protein [Caldilineaceae bacterium]